MSKYTTADVAARYAISPRRVLAIAKARGVDGRMVGTVWLWTEAQAKRLRPGPSGRPKS